MQEEAHFVPALKSVRWQRPTEPDAVPTPIVAAGAKLTP